MAFDTIPPVTTAQELIDAALGKGRKAAAAHPKENKERERIIAINRYVGRRIQAIIKSFPSIDQLNEFYAALVYELSDRDQAKQSLGALQWARTRINELARQDTAIFIGRMSSCLKQISSDLEFLEQLRRTMTSWPSIKELPTVALVGFPNVGKSTLLSRLTSATPKIAPYAFTTTGINSGVFSVSYKTIQVLDTPGTLNRPHQMNTVERIAYIAQYHASQMLIFVLDPTDTYPIELQKQLYERTCQIGRPVNIFISKKDIATPQVIDALHQLFPQSIDTIEQLRIVIVRQLLGEAYVKRITKSSVSASDKQ